MAIKKQMLIAINVYKMMCPHRELGKNNWHKIINTVITSQILQTVHAIFVI